MKNVLWVELQTKYVWDKRYFPFYCRLQEIYIEKAEKKILKKLKLKLSLLQRKKLP